MSPKKPFQRLPTSVIPLVYDLTLKPDLHKFTFEGAEKIAIKVNETTQTITLNVNEIEISKDGLTVSYSDKTIDIEKIEYSTENETATLHFKEQLSAGEALLNLKFTGILNDKLKGFYRSKYVGPDGEERNVACTQFEATDARRAFPCWDEPAHKAKFDVSLIVPNDGKTIALSNMSVLSEVNNELSKEKVVKFKQTPIMSTYLVAFVVGEFEYIQTKSEDGVLVRVYAPLGKKEQGRFALDMTAKALDYYRQYFDIAYPLDKMDLIAIPDFACGAMENWGLVTYRETCLLVDSANTSTARKQWVALVVAHELAHQWFGNLVTMEWWTHLWLNEGFASFIEYLCVDELFPQFDIWTQFVADTFLEAMELDGLENSHPIEVPVGHPSEVDEIFDDISYAKGASVIRSLHKYIGDQAFRKGMNLYLTRHSYKNTQTEDLWDALEEASKKPVRRVMTTWTKQKGYPVISVSAVSDPATSKPTQIVQLHQEKFNLNGVLSDEDKKSLWAVPLEIVAQSSGGSPIVADLFESRELKVNLEIGAEEWFKLNPSTVATYRTRYSPELLSKFLPGITARTIPALDRLGLLNDLFALVQAGKQRTVDLLKFIASFEGEDNYTVWSALSSILIKYDQLFAGTEFHAKFRKFGCNLLNANVFKQIGWEPKPDESHLNTLLRSLVINRLVGFEDGKVIAHCQQLFKGQVEEKKIIPADLRVAAYRGVACDADDSVFETLLKVYRESDLQEEKNRVSTALGHVKNEALIQRVLDFSLSDEVRSQDAVFVIGAVANNPLGREAAWKFFQKNQSTFISRYGAGMLICRLIKLVTENFTSEERAYEVEKFFVDNKFPGSERSVKQAVETIRLNDSLLKRDSAEVAKFFESI